ncbi:hypothetical protein QBC35DRAFT_478721 [Podospora australis]|uniref:Uncharacterized protein n=1 Tax=Podospora australis TaxID=1536484 RepID=A0AAN7AEB4_9PEZI|nr:hypothetical protein QBC35DRAFT_478721 [Podospora australis]
MYHEERGIDEFTQKDRLHQPQTVHIRLADESTSAMPPCLVDDHHSPGSYSKPQSTIKVARATRSSIIIIGYICLSQKVGVVRESISAARVQPQSVELCHLEPHHRQTFWSTRAITGLGESLTTSTSQPQPMTLSSNFIIGWVLYIKRTLFHKSLVFGLTPFLSLCQVRVSIEQPQSSERTRRGRNIAVEVCHRPGVRRLGSVVQFHHRLLRSRNACCDVVSLVVSMITDQPQSQLDNDQSDDTKAWTSSLTVSVAKVAAHLWTTEFHRRRSEGEACRGKRAGGTEITRAVVHSPDFVWRKEEESGRFGGAVGFR